MIRPVAGTTAAGIACLLLLFALAAGADAHDTGYESRVTARTSDNVEYRGRVFSSRACRRGRTVKLYNEQPGTDNLLGEDRTDADGRWSVMIAAPGTGYYAKVLRRVIKRPGHRHTCRGARSETTPY